MNGIFLIGIANDRYGRDYYINDAKVSSGTRKMNHVYVDGSTAHSTDQDYNNNRNRCKRISGSDHDHMSDSDSVSDLEIIFNRKQIRNAVTLSRKVRKPWPPANSLLKRSMSLCSVRSFTYRAINNSDRMRSSTHSTSSYNGNSSNCSLDQLAPRSIGQIEEQALRGDIRRCSFRSRNGTNNFVVNPLFDEYGTEF